LRDPGFVDKCPHFVGQSRDTFRVAESGLEQRLVPKGRQPRVRPSQQASACVRPLQPRAPLLDEPGMKKVDAVQPQQRDLWIGHEDFDRRQFEKLRGREPALDPCASRAQSTLKLSHVSVHDTRDEHKHRIVGCRRERLGSFRHRQRLGIVRPQAENEREPVQQPSAHRMIGDVGEKRVRTLERVFRFGMTDAMYVGGRYSMKRGQRDLQRVALGAPPAPGQEGSTHAR
jgi:hypothetical protein